MTNLLPTSYNLPAVIAIDASSANKDKRSGVEEYGFQLIEALKRRALGEGRRVVLYSPSELTEALAVLPSGWDSQVLKWSLGRGWMQGRVSWELARRAPELLFVPSQSLPRSGKVPMVTMVHDVGFARRPDVYSLQDRRAQERSIKCALKRAKMLLVPTEFTKREIVDVYGVGPERIVVTPEAAGEMYRVIEPNVVERTLKAHRLSRSFFLYVGRLDKKKNVETLIQAFELFKQSRGVGDPHELVLVGSPGFGWDQMKLFVERSKVKDQIRVLGYVSDEDVVALMNACTAFCFPSWYEGFGIPNVEAMSCGAPVICSDIEPHREVCGEAATFVSPEHIDPWVEALTRAANDSGWRERMREASLERAKLFSWDTTAEQTWGVFESLL